MEDESPEERLAINFLRVWAWLLLLCGIISAIYTWANVSQRIKPGTSSITESNPFDIICGVAFLAAGISGFAFFLVVSLIAEKVTEIRNALPVKSQDG